MVFSLFFFSLFVTCPDEKIGFQCTNKARRKKMNAHRLPITTSLALEWSVESPELWGQNTVCGRRGQCPQAQGSGSRILKQQFFFFF